jgi:hypothetical protein
MMGEAFVKKQELFLRQREQQQQLQQQPTEYDEDDEERHCQEASMCRPSPRSRHPGSPSTIQSQMHHQSFASAFWDKGPLALITDELCTGMGCQGVEDSPSSAGSFISSPGSNKKYDRFSCSSRALGSADTLDVQDSFLDASTIASMRSSESAAKTPKQTSPLNKQKVATWKLAQSTSLIQAERDLLLSYRKTALSTMERVQVLVEEEEHIGLAWKRFGIAVSNLFSYEKEVENARLGDKKIHRDAMPYRKVKKATVDHCMKALIQQKTDRSVRALRILGAMLTAYVADLSAVSPSVDAYLEGMNQMAIFEEYFEAETKKQRDQCNAMKDGSSTDSTTSQTSSDDDRPRNISKLIGSFSDRIRSLTVPKKEDCKDKDIVRTSSSSSSSALVRNDTELLAPASEQNKKRLVEDRVLANERLVRESLTMLCKSTTMRSARMAYAYFKAEAAQCGFLRSAAASLRAKIDLANNEQVSQMISRHRVEDNEDMKTELALAQRIVNLGSTKKNSLAGFDANGGSDTVGVASNDDKERALSVMRDNALLVAKERVGRWNSDLAMSIMKSVGVNDPNVRVEETTRELRLVRKYAIGLRENLNRCIEAVDLLRNAILQGGRKDMNGVDRKKAPAKHIMETRKEYFAEAAKLFSGIMEEPSTSPKNSAVLPSPKSLPRAGIKLNDPMGWSTPFVELSSKIVQVSAIFSLLITFSICGIHLLILTNLAGKYWQSTRGLWGYLTDVPEN